MAKRTGFKNNTDIIGSENKTDIKNDTDKIENIPPELPTAVPEKINEKPKRRSRGRSGRGKAFKDNEPDNEVAATEPAESDVSEDQGQAVDPPAFVSLAEIAQVIKTKPVIKKVPTAKKVSVIKEDPVLKEEPDQKTRSSSRRRGRSKNSP
jgi:hypothetical protein